MSLDKSVVTPKKFAQLYDLSLPTVYKHLKTGQIPATRIGKQWYINLKDLPLANPVKKEGDGN